jgi:hypothetical protein
LKGLLKASIKKHHGSLAIIGSVVNFFPAATGASTATMPKTPASLSGGEKNDGGRALSLAANARK